MIYDIFSMNGYGIYVWSAFSFTLICFAVLYLIIKFHLTKQQEIFNKKFTNLTYEKIQSAKQQKVYKEILANTSIYKI
tara:strand:- start:5 stop:238 length:234 start_codon:yes stop_codon:yes gene_type:complete